MPCGGLMKHSYLTVGLVLALAPSAWAGEIVLTGTDALRFEPHISPDGTRLLYMLRPSNCTAFCPEQVAVSNIDGTGEVLLTTPAIRAIEPQWSPDGTRI